MAGYESTDFEEEFVSGDDFTPDDDLDSTPLNEQEKVKMPYPMTPEEYAEYKKALSESEESQDEV